MPRTISESEISHNESQLFSTGNCNKVLGEEENCLVDVVNKFPVINELQTKTSRRDNSTLSSKVISLPKLNLDNISEPRMDSGEPYGNAYGRSATDIRTFKQACGNLKQFQKLGMSSSEELQRSFLLFDNDSSSGRSSGQSNVFEDFHIQGDNEEAEESRALKRWEYWLKEKKKVQNYLSKRLGRPVNELMMQEADKFREVMEKKMMEWHSRIAEPDDQKGTPGRSEPQLRLKNKKTPTQYCSIISKVEKEDRPEIEFIGIPDTVKKEKGLLSEDPRRKKKTKPKRKVHCKEESNCDSHEIEMEELAVVGTKIVNNTMNSNSLVRSDDIPEITVEKCQDEEEPSKFEERTSVFSLVIGDEEIKYEYGSESRQGPDRMLVWNVDFGVNMAGETTEKVLRVENRGTIAVRYDWLPSILEKRSSLGGLQPRRYEPWFFFNKNSGYFLPGQIHDLKFYFQGRASGIRKETWYLKTEPPLSEKGELGTVVLSGVATEEYSTENKTLELYLENRVMESCICAIIEEMIYKASDPCYGLLDIEYRCFFTEKQLFEYQNSKHFYHSSLVKELKKIFEEIFDKNQREWDLSINSLWNLVKIYKTGKEKSPSLGVVAEISKKLYRPNYLPERNLAGYRMSYAVLCKMINFIEYDYNSVRTLVSEKMEEPIRWRDLGEARESEISTETLPEEMGETDFKPETILQIRPINYMFFRTLIYLKTYRRICDAAEEIAGIFETRKRFKPWKSVNYKPPKPPRIAKSPTVCVNWKCVWPEQLKAQVKILSPK